MEKGRRGRGKGKELKVVEEGGRDGCGDGCTRQKRQKDGRAGRYNMFKTRPTHLQPAAIPDELFIPTINLFLQNNS